MPWRSIGDAGNFYRHSYDTVAASFIWEAARDGLRSLLAVVASELANEDGGNGSKT